MSDEIIKLKELVEKSSPTNLTKIIKKDPALVTFIDNSTKNKKYTTFSEQIWLTLNPNFDQICNLGNSKKFISFTQGFGFCGKPGTCGCAKQDRSEKISKSRKIKQNFIPIDYDYLKADELLLKELDQLILENPKLIDVVITRNQQINNLIRSVMTQFSIGNAEAAYICVNRLTPKLCECGNKASFTSYKSGYKRFCREHCSARNKNQSIKIAEIQANVTLEERKLRLEKQKATMNENHGADFPIQVSYIKAKMEATNMERIGAKTPFESEIVVNKIKQTNLEKIGVEYPLQSAEIREKGLKTNQLNHPNEPDIMAVPRKAFLDQNDGQNPFVVFKDKVKETLFNNYQVDHPSKNPMLLHKRSNTFYEKHKRYDFNQLNFSEETWNILTNYNLFKVEYEQLGALSLAEKLNVDQGTIYRKAKEYNLFIKSRSNSEDAIKNFILSLGEQIKTNDRKICKEYNSLLRKIDIVIPNKLCIEYCGLYWHSELMDKNREYHLSKLKACEHAGMQLLTIFEDEWLSKPDVVKNKIKIALGITKPITGGRNIKIKQITNAEAKPFLIKYHLQGHVNSEICVGAFYDDNLVSVMTFGRWVMPHTNSILYWELKRFSCDFGRYPGIANKLLTFFESNFKPFALISYADRRWSQGNLYKKLGFELTSVVDPSYWYIVKGKREHRSNYTKKRIIKKFNIQEPFTEIEAMKNLGFTRIWDCGNLRFEKWYK
jgi:hypothetical protein